MPAFSDNAAARAFAAAAATLFRNMLSSGEPYRSRTLAARQPEPAPEPEPESEPEPEPEPESEPEPEPDPEHTYIHT